MLLIAKFLQSLRQFDDDFFTIHVAEQTFVVHARVLHKSPVFAAMSREPFKESKTRVFELSDDDPIVFALFIEYLYSARDKLPELEDLQKEFSEPKEYLFDVLAKAYVLGDKYGVPGIQTSVVEISRRLHWREDPRHTLRMAELIYGQTSSTSNDPYRVWFSKAACTLLKKMNEDTKHTVHNLLRKGNELSIVIFEAQGKALEDSRAEITRLNKLEVGSPALVDAKSRLMVAKRQLEDVQIEVYELEEEIERLVQDLD